MLVLVKRVVCVSLLTCGLSAAQQVDAVAQIKALLGRGNAVEADHRSDLALRSFPRSAPLWTLKGIASDSLKEPEQALKAYYTALSIDPEYLPALEGAAQGEFRKRSQKAVPLLDRAQKLSPSDKTISAMLGILAYLRGDCGKTVVYFEHTGPMAEWSPGTLQEYGTCLVRLNDLKRAAQVFSALLKREPGNEKARYNLAVVEFEAGQYSSVQQTLAPLLEREMPDPDSLSLAAEASESLFDTPRAVDLLRRGIAAYPQSPQFYIALADLSLTHRSFQVGVDLLNAGITRLPADASLRFARGVLYLEMSEYEKSEEDFDVAETLDPGLPLGSAARALAKLDIHQPIEAERLARAQLASHPDDPDLNYVLAESIRMQGPPPESEELKDAELAAEKATRLQPRFAGARLVLSRLYLESGKLDQAVAQAEEAARLAPEDATALYNLILASKRSGRTDQLARLVKRLEEIKQASARKRQHLRRYELAEKPPEGDSPQLP
jgi:tetratricopeptide (TPR) repeat protein